MRESAPAKQRVVFVGLASCFGCQVQITNAEPHLLGLLDQIDLRYWQLTSSDLMPEEYDVAVVEGAVTTEEARQMLLQVRERARVVIAMGACATTAGIPGLAAQGFDGCVADVYDEAAPEACGAMTAPMPVDSVIDVDFQVRCCPVDPYAFISVLQRALYGSNRAVRTSTLCGECRRNETECLLAQGQPCLGMVTQEGCGARCVSLGRACNGCAGLSPDANLEQAYAAAEACGVSAARFGEALQLFNKTNPAFSVAEHATDTATE